MAIEALSRPGFALPEGWRTFTFGEMVRNVDVQERDPLGQGIDRYVGLEHIEPRNLHIKSWGNVADGTTFTRRFRPGQVLFGKRRAYQRKAALAEFDGICSGDILVFEPKSRELIPELLPFIVESDGFFEHALRTSAGSLSPRTKWKELADYAFPLPPKPEQQRIAEILWAADAAVERWRTCEHSLASQVPSILTDRLSSGSESDVYEAKLGDVAKFFSGNSRNRRVLRPVRPQLLCQNLANTCDEQAFTDWATLSRASSMPQHEWAFAESLSSKV